MTMAAALRIREIHQVLRKTRASQVESIGLNDQDRDISESNRCQVNRTRDPTPCSDLYRQCSQGKHIRSGKVP